MSLSEKIKRARNILGKNSSGANNWAIVHETGNTRYHYHRECYGSMNDTRPGKAFIAFPLSGGIQSRGNLSKEDVIEYLSWLITESAWADAFITKDLKEIEDRGMVLDVSKPASYVIQACIMFRYHYDHTYVLDIWKVFSQLCNKDLAFIASHYFSLIGIEKRYIIDRGFGGGSAFAAYMGYHFGVPELKKVIARDYSLFASLPPMSESFCYSPLSKCWNVEAKEYDLVTVTKKRISIPTLKDIKIKGEWGSVLSYHGLPIKEMDSVLWQFIERNGLGKVA